MTSQDADLEKYSALKLNDQSIDEYESESVDPRVQVNNSKGCFFIFNF
jgi:hypothetical protein